jgi:hypothetical protein
MIETLDIISDEEGGGGEGGLPTGFCCFVTYLSHSPLCFGSREVDHRCVTGDVTSGEPSRAQGRRDGDRERGAGGRESRRGGRRGGGGARGDGWTGRLLVDARLAVIESRK